MASCLPVDQPRGSEALLGTPVLKRWDLPGGADWEHTNIWFQPHTPRAPKRKSTDFEETGITKAVALPAREVSTAVIPAGEAAAPPQSLKNDDGNYDSEGFGFDAPEDSDDGGHFLIRSGRITEMLEKLSWGDGSFLSLGTERNESGVQVSKSSKKSATLCKAINAELRKVVRETPMQWSALRVLRDLGPYGDGLPGLGLQNAILSYLGQTGRIARWWPHAIGA